MRYHNPFLPCQPTAGKGARLTYQWPAIPRPPQTLHPPPCFLNPAHTCYHMEAAYGHEQSADIETDLRGCLSAPKPTLHPVPHASPLAVQYMEAAYGHEQSAEPRDIGLRSRPHLNPHTSPFAAAVHGGSLRPRAECGAGHRSSELPVPAPGSAWHAGHRHPAGRCAGRKRGGQDRVPELVGGRMADEARFRSRVEEVHSFAVAPLSLSSSLPPHPLPTICHTQVRLVRTQSSPAAAMEGALPPTHTFTLSHKCRSVSCAHSPALQQRRHPGLLLRRGTLRPAPKRRGPLL